MDIVDHYLSDFCLVLTAISQCALVGYFIASEGLIGKVRKEWRGSSAYTSMEEGTLESPQTPDLNQNELQQPEKPWKRKLKRYWGVASAIIFHSVDEFRLKIKEICRFGPHREWSIFIKYVEPVILLVLLIIQLVKEIISPYNTKGAHSTEFDWVSLTVGLCIIIPYLLVLVVFAIFPRLLRQKSEVVGRTWKEELELHKLEDAKKEMENSPPADQQATENDTTEQVQPVTEVEMENK